MADAGPRFRRPLDWRNEPQDLFTD